MYRGIQLMRDPNPAGGTGTITVTPEAINSLQGDAFRNVIPEDVRGQGWMKDVNSFGDFVKKAANAQSLIGQRALPSETDPQEKWDAWFAQAGRPEKPDAYVFPEKIDGVPDEFLKEAAKIPALKLALHAGGVNQYQAKTILSHMLKHFYSAEVAEAKASTAAKAEEKAKADAAHEKLMNETFGKDRAAITENGKRYLMTVLPPNIQALIPAMTDQQLAVLLAATDSVARKFGQEDNFRGGKDFNGGSGAETMDSLKAQMRDIMGQKEYQDPFLNKNKHLELNQKMQAIREKMQKLSVNP